MIPETLVINGETFKRYIPPVPVSNLYHVCTDLEVGRYNRPGKPMIWVFSDADVKLTKEWQFFIKAINPGMTLKHISAIFGDSKAFCNGTGFEGATPRKNYILNENLSAAELPRFDKVRTCGNTVIQMDNGIVMMMNGNATPPLKPGVAQPQTLAEATLDKYLYTPQFYPHLFFNAVTTRPDFTVGAFPNGAVYSWTGDNFPRTFLPHVAPIQIVYPPKDITDNTPTLRVI